MGCHPTPLNNKLKQIEDPCWPSGRFKCWGDQSQRDDGSCQKRPHWRTRRVVSHRRKGRCGHSRRPPTSWRSSNAVRRGSTRAPRDFQHQALLGKRRTSDAARYPNDLAMEYARQLGMMEAPGKGAQDATHGLAEELD